MVEPSVLVRWCFFSFVVSLAFDAIGMGEISISPSRVMGYLLFVAAVVDFRACFARVPLVFWMLVAYAGVGFLSGLPFFSLARLGAVLSIPQGVLLFLISLNLLSSPRIWDDFVIALLLCTGILVLACVLGLGLGANEVSQEYVAGEGYYERSGFMGEDPNVVASFVAIGLGNALMVILSPRRGRWFLRLVAVAVAAGAMYSMVATTSRGGLVVAAVALTGVGFYFLRGVHKLYAIAVVGAMTLCLGFMVASSPLFRARVMDTVETGNTASRAEIFLSSVDVWKESPFIGLGNVVYMVELGGSVTSKGIGGGITATHNIFLSALVGSGIVGALSFAVAIGLVVVTVFLRRADIDARIALVLLLSLLAAGMSLNIEQKKWFWLILGGAAAISLRPVRGPLPSRANSHIQKFRDSL